MFPASVYPSFIFGLDRQLVSRSDETGIRPRGRRFLRWRHFARSSHEWKWSPVGGGGSLDADPGCCLSLPRLFRRVPTLWSRPGSTDSPNTRRLRAQGSLSGFDLRCPRALRFCEGCGLRGHHGDQWRHHPGSRQARRDRPGGARDQDDQESGLLRRLDREPPLRSREGWRPQERRGVPEGRREGKGESRRNDHPPEHALHV